MLQRITNDGWALELVPPQDQTYEMCLAAVKQNGHFLRNVIPRFRTHELCIEVVSRFGWAIKYLSKAEKTRAISLEAVRQYGWALEFIDDQWEELCIEAVSRKNGQRQSGKVIQWVKKRTPAINLAAVRQDAQALEYIPYDEQTKEMHHLAIEQDGRFIEFVDPKYRWSLYQKAVKVGKTPTSYETPWVGWDCRRTSLVYNEAVKVNAYMTILLGEA